MQANNRRARIASTLALALACALGAAGCDDGGETPETLGAGGAAGAGGMPEPTPEPTPEPEDTCACDGQQTCDDAGECVEPEVCAGDVDCLAGRRCVDGACVDACAGDADCDDGQRCDPEGGVCVADDRCQGDEDCMGGACVDGACEAPCAEGDCPGRQTCDPMTGACLEPDDCADDIDCQDDRICVEGRCASPCGEDADCPGAQLCADGMCAEPAACAGDDDCIGDRICQGDGQCIDPCNQAGCPGDLVCDPGAGRCGEADPCAGDSGCFDGRRCVEGVCEDPCVEDADCPGMLRCEAGACVPPTDCVIDDACVEGQICVDEQCVDRCPARACPDGAVCDEETGRCAVPFGCAEAADCGGAQQCIDGTCVEPAFCNGDADCLGERACRDGQCVTPCGRDDDCPGAQVCAGGVCAEGPGCDGDGDCVGGRACHPELAACVDRCPDGFCPGGQDCGPDGLCGEPFRCLDDGQCVGERRCLFGRCAGGECGENIDCDGGDICVDGLCAEAAPGACACPEGWGCVEGGCVQPGPCEAGTCPAPWACGADGLCARCDGDDDCPRGGLCADSACVDPPVCGAEDDCLPGHVCAIDRCEVDFDCPDDALDNVGPDRALPIPAGALGDLFICEGQPDWFRIGSDQGLRVIARFDPALPPARVSIYAADDIFTPVEVASIQPGEARVEVGPGEYLVEISARNGGRGVYSLEVQDGLDCPDDPWSRPWPNDARDRARAIGVGEARGVLCGRDADWYRVGLGRPLRVEIEGATARVDGRQAPVDVVGPATIEVSGPPGAAYTLSVSAPADPDAACADAAPLALDAPVDASIEDGGDDFAPGCRGPGGPDRVFRLRAPRAGALALNLTAPDPRAALLVYRDCGGEPVACSGAAGGVELDVEPGDYFVVVDGPYQGQLLASLAAISPLCDAPEPLAVGETVIDLPVGPADIAGACTDPEQGAVVRAFSLEAPSFARVALAGGGDEPLVSVRSACGSGDSVRACELGQDAQVAPALPAGDYVAIIQGEGQVTVTFEVEPADGAPVFEGACGPQAPELAAGADLALEGDLAAALDDIDLAACGGGPGAADAVARFTLAEAATVSAFIEAAAFPARLAVVDAACAEVTECGSPMTGDVLADLPAGTYGLVMEGDQPGQGGPFRVRLQVR